VSSDKFEINTKLLSQGHTGTDFWSAWRQPCPGCPTLRTAPGYDAVRVNKYARFVFSVSARELHY